MALPLLAVPLLTPQGIAVSAAAATMLYKGGHYAYHAVTGMMEARKSAREYETFKSKVDCNVEGDRAEGYRIVFNWFNFSHSMAIGKFRSYPHGEVCDALIVEFTHKAATRGERGPNSDEIAKAVSAASRKVGQFA